MTFRGILVSLALTVLGLAHPPSATAQETVFIVRHTDPPPMLRIDEIREDTPLSESGWTRAQALAARLRDANITAIYTSEALRTIQTAEPLAEAIHVKAQVHLGDDVDGLITELQSKHRDERILIVGHWSTIPLILKRLGVQDEATIERSEFDNLFVVMPREENLPLMVHLHY